MNKNTGRTKYSNKVQWSYLKYTSLAIIFIFGLMTISETRRPKKPKIMSIQVVAANVWQQGDEESDADVAERLYKSGKLIGDKFGFWSFIAANELAGDLTGWALTVRRWRAKALNCPYDESDEKLLSINCLEKGLRRMTDPNHLMHQKGELGIIASNLYFEQLPVNEAGDLEYHKLIGPERTGGIQRRLIASRFKSKTFNKNVLFVSTHLSHAGSPEERQEELRDLIRNIKEIFTPGDLTPILAGDFNCRSWKAGLRRIIYQDFMIVDEAGSIDNVFIGRPQSFPENGGVLLPKANSVVRLRPYYQGTKLSDHEYFSAVVEYDPDNQPTYLAPPEIGTGEGCVKP